MTDRTDDPPGDSSHDEFMRAVAKAPEVSPPGPEDAASRVHPGDVLAKKYRVERVLGEGGMGVVVAAHHLLLDEKVALKFLLPKGLKNAEAVGRFAREARAAAKIKSEHVARVTDVGELENGAPYIVMEYLEGSDLAAWLAERGPAPTQQAVGFILQACEALAEAHVLGIVHRDLKPGNLFLAKRPGGPPIVKVLDFGISKSALSASEPQLTKTSAIMGSPLYMSPEQMQSSKTVDVRSDIWALGVVLYELLSGRAPFHGDTMPELIVAVLQKQQEPLHSVRPDLPTGLEAVVNRCLAKDPAARFQNVRELAVALAPFGPPRSEVSVERVSQVLGAQRDAAGVVVVARTHGFSVSPIEGGAAQGGDATLREGLPPAQTGPNKHLTGASTTSKPVSSDQPSIIPSHKPPRSRRWVLPSAGLVVLLGAGGALAWRTISSRPSEPAASQVTDPSLQPSSTLVVPLPAASMPALPATPVAPATGVDSPGPSTSSASSPATQAQAPRAAPNVQRPTSTATQSAPLPAASKTNCDPPYTIDSAGMKHYKRECNN